MTGEAKIGRSCPQCSRRPPVPWLRRAKFGIVLWHALGIVHEKFEKRIQRGDRSVALFRNRRVGVKTAVEKPFEPALCSAAPGENPASLFPAWRMSSTVCAPLASTWRRVVLDQVGRKMVENALERFVEFQLAAAAWDSGDRPRHRPHRRGHFGAKPIEIEQSCLKTVVEVGGVVGNFVHQIDQLSFERRPLVQQIFGESRERPPEKWSRECLTIPSRTSKVRFKPGNSR